MQNSVSIVRCLTVNQFDKQPLTVLRFGMIDDFSQNIFDTYL